MVAIEPRDNRHASFVPRFARPGAAHEATTTVPARRRGGGDGLQGRVFGYQGWFTTPATGRGNRGPTTAKAGFELGTCLIDYWPDICPPRCHMKRTARVRSAQALPNSRAPLYCTGAGRAKRPSYSGVAGRPAAARACARGFRSQEDVRKSRRRSTPVAYRAARARNKCVQTC